MKRNVSTLLKRAASLGALAGCAAVFSVTAADSPVPAKSTEQGEPSPTLKVRVAQFQVGLSTFEETGALLVAELDQLPLHYANSEKSKACYAQLTPALESVQIDSKPVLTALATGHSCDEHSPAACWIPVFDRADQALEKLTSEARELRVALEQCRLAGA